MNILIALDDSSSAKLITDYVCAADCYAQSYFRLIHVMNPIMISERPSIAYPLFLEPADNSYKIEAQAMLKEAAKRLHTRFGNHCLINADVLVGLPENVILQEAADWPADLIVVGSHGRSGFKKFLLGSVSGDIVSRSPCSVMVVTLRKNDLSQKLQPDEQQIHNPQSKQINSTARKAQRK